MMDASKYRVGYFPVDAKYNKWVEKDHIEKPPVWCSVDMRDGNQSLVIPMSLEEKLEYYNTLLAVLTALTIVLGMRMMGAMLISSLVIFPALSAMRVLKSFRGVVICSGCISVASFCVGLTSSYLLGTPVGASVVLVDLAVFLVCCGIARVKKAN